jgi:hypothetical protein
LGKFADSPDDVLEDRDCVTCTINGEDLSLSLIESDDVLMCCEDGQHPIKARQWIELRLARLDILAQKIKDIIKYDTHFVTVKSRFQTIDAEDEDIEDTVVSITERLNAPSKFSTEVVYILSEAGDGKSMIMNRLAYLSALSYLEKRGGAIFLPISLDGRPFLRIDDLVVGILANHFRFRYCYFDAIIELIKMGSLVLGLDGFEEMVVEGKEEKVISSLGELLKELSSCGRLVISARRAFYDYALRNQIPLLESLKEIYADFNAYRLLQWQRREVVTLMESYEQLHGREGAIFALLEQRFGIDHPIITRPVLARHLIDVIASEIQRNNDWEVTIKKITSDKDPQKVMSDFVDLLVIREANYKWLVTSGPTKGCPILTVGEHNNILQALAEDMWLSNMEFVKQEYLQDWVEFICLDLKKSPIETADCREKILHHAILLRDGDKYYFCHDAFRKYFLGIAISNKIIKKEDSYSLVRMLSQDILDFMIVDKIVFEIVKAEVDFETLSSFLQDIKGGASRLTPIGQNVGSILMCYSKSCQPQALTVLKELFFTATSTIGAKLVHVRFIDCTFENLEFDHTVVEDVVIEHCTIMKATIDKYRKIDGLVISDNSMPTAVCFRGTDEYVYNPDVIRRNLTRMGSIDAGDRQTDESIGNKTYDELLKVVIQLAHLFQRTSGLSDKAMEVRFGRRWPRMQAEFLPRFIADGIIEKRDWYGGGGNYRYKMAINMVRFEEALREAEGSYDCFLSLVKNCE